MPVPRATPSAVTSPIYRIRGQRSNWRYPNERLTPEHTVKMRDINLSERGTADSRLGYELYNSTVLPSSEAVVGLIQETFSTGTGELVVTPTKIYVDDGTTRTDATGALTLTAGGDEDRVRHAFINDQVVATNQKDETWVHDNDFSTPSVATALSGMPWTTVDDLVAHKGLLFGLAPTEGGTKYNTRVRWCDIDESTLTPTITSWPDANRFEIYQGGAPIVGAVDNFGYVLVFKEDGLYPLSLKTTTGFFEITIDEELGVRRGFSPISLASIISRPEFVWVVAREGAFVITPELEVSRVTADIDDEWRGLNQGRLQYATSYYREGDHQIRTLVSSSSNTAGHDLELVYDWETGDTWFDEPSDTLNFGSRIIQSNEEYDWVGTEDGWIFKKNVASVLEDNTTDFSWHIEMAPNDLGLPGRLKKIIDVRFLTVQKTGQRDVQVDLLFDQGRATYQSQSMTIGSGLKWNDAGSLWNNGGPKRIWPGGSNEATSVWVNRTAETIAPRLIGEQPISVVGYQVEYIPLE